MEEPDGPDRGREYRIGELAKAAGIPVRTLRYYQERKLLPPPRRAGRIGLYSEDHLARLRMIADLLERGHTLEGIRELLSAWEQGRDIRAVLGVEKAVTTPWSNEVPVTMTLDELTTLFGRESLERAIALGHIEVEGDRVTHWSRRQLDATVTLVRAGVPLEDVLSAGRELQRSMDDLAAMYVRLIATHVVGRIDDQHHDQDHHQGHGHNDHDLGELTEALARLRPGAEVTVEAGFARAMDRQVRAAIDQALGRLAS
ncbi:MerR family transcriptional regulator [Actinomadura soli]|uniref:MerR family transcriptional regulator n=2 Tax=Actinomadura soli TaxID=2508997 RepID=A0A5C4JCJ1_9ACTN|nr:MerR family transcriptional regulator [Actinomadura soli]